MEARHYSVVTLRLVLVALIALAALSWLCSHRHLGPWGTPIALGIAGVKALLIAVVFIGLGRQGSSNRLTLIVAATLAVILIGFMVADVTAR